jgi:low affinity Fe/Cu permease
MPHRAPAPKPASGEKPAVKKQRPPRPAEKWSDHPWRYIVVLLVIPILLVMAHSTLSDHHSSPLKSVFSDPKDKPNVIGTWTEGRLVDPQMQDVPVLYVGENIVVRVEDLDGWVLRQLAYGTFKDETLSPGDSDVLKSWALKLVNAADNKSAGTTGQISDTAPSITKDATTPPVKSAPAPAPGTIADTAPSLTIKLPQALPSVLVGGAATNTAPVTPAAPGTGTDAGSNTPNPDAKWAQQHFNAFFYNCKNNLHLVMNGIDLNDITPSNSVTVYLPSGSNTDPRQDDIVFTLSRSSPSLNVLVKKLAAGVGLSNQVSISVGYQPSATQRSAMMDSLVGPLAQSIIQTPVLHFATLTHVFLALSALLLVIIAVIILSARDNLLRSSDGTLRPDGNYQVSLSAFQLTFWFFIVLFSYVYIWAITGDLSCFSTTALALVGIALTTAAGSQAVQQMVSPNDEIKKYNAVIEGRSAATSANLDETLAAQKETLNARYQTVVQQSGEDSDAAVKILNALEDVERQQKYLKLDWFEKILTDLCSEHGDVTPHRFQMLAWTLVLGAIFIIEVFDNLTMPTFPDQLLLLMGLSAGSYLGFRIPEAQRLKSSLVAPESVIAQPTAGPANPPPDPEMGAAPAPHPPAPVPVPATPNLVGTPNPVPESLLGPATEGTANPPAPKADG